MKASIHTTRPWALGVSAVPCAAVPAQRRVTASDARADDWFGSALGLDGEVAVVVAWRNDDGAADPRPR